MSQLQGHDQHNLDLQRLSKRGVAYQPTKQDAEGPSGPNLVANTE